MRPQPELSLHLAAAASSAASRRAGARRLTIWLASAAAHLAVLALAATVSSPRARAGQDHARLPATYTRIRRVHAAPPLACAPARGPSAAARPWRPLRPIHRLALPAPGRRLDRALRLDQRIARTRLTETIAHLDADGGARTSGRLRPAGSFDALLWGPGAPAARRLGRCADEAPLTAVTVLYGPVR